MSSQLEKRNQKRQPPELFRPQPIKLALPKPGDNLPQVMDLLAAVQEQANLLVPVQAIREVPEGFELSFAGMQLNMNPHVGDYYIPKVYDDAGIERWVDQAHANSKVALPFNTVKRLGQIADIHVVALNRVDDRSDPWVCEFEAHVMGWTFDGQRKPAFGNYRLDLRDEVVEKIKMSAKQLQGKRQYIDRLCESTALRRAFAQWLALKSSYTVEEIRRPFIMARLRFMPDMNDPVIKRMVTAAALNIRQDLYPQPALAAIGDGGTQVQDGEIFYEEEPVSNVAEIAEEESQATPPEPDLGAFPVVRLPESLADLQLDARRGLIEELIEITSYDYDGVFEAKGMDPIPVSKLPEKWLQAVYGKLIPIYLEMKSKAESEANPFA